MTLRQPTRDVQQRRCRTSAADATESSLHLRMQKARE